MVVSSGGPSSGGTSLLSVATRGLPPGELRRLVRDRGAAGAAAMPPAVAAGGLLLAAMPMAKNSFVSSHTKSSCSVEM